MFSFWLEIDRIDFSFLQIQFNSRIAVRIVFVPAVERPLIPR